MSRIGAPDWLSRLALSPFVLPLLLLSTTAWFVLGNWFWPLLNPDEGRYVGVALEMLHAHEWGTPLLNGMPYFHKPPLFYWLTAASMAVFGENEFAVRLAPALAGLLMVGGLFVFVRRFVLPSRALVAAVILAATPLMFGAAHYANLDLLVAAMITSTILCGATAVLLLQQGESPTKWVLAMYLFAGLGFLAKGLIGFVLPGGVLLIWLLAERRFSAIPVLLRLSGILLFLLVVLPWLFLMQSRYPGFLHYYLVYQQFERFSQGGFNNVMPVWFYVAVLLASMLPWYRSGLSAIFTRHYWRPERDAGVRRLMWVWLLLILAFFSIPQSKLVGYILPVLPPLAFLFAEFYRGIFTGDRTTAAAQNTNLAEPDVAGRAQQRYFLGRVLACVALGIAGLVYLSVAHLPGSSRLVTAMDRAPQTMVGAHDRYYSLDNYPFDFRFYTGHNPDLYVVSDWNDPALSTKDNWQKELWDANNFGAPGSASHLLLPADFLRSVCVPVDYRRWLLADAKQMDNYPELKKLTPYFEEDRRRVYLVPAGQVLPFCASRPVPSAQ
ncbi:putative glycosyltransferase, family 39 [Advenella mimigardefordensis DPN7]|uniref:Putative glycosyltransferase, family 39 n=1 Tax=Advenella mimigardefordensis (strain DSM 17166 / LMG 22922 / DPN7) TaxID=1247726 RepID=W0PC58_ADVMD|nr:putative glycosyltransferase, family 39 [Advenella mimigardefordensis DPN7]